MRNNLKSLMIIISTLIIWVLLQMILQFGVDGQILFFIEFHIALTLIIHFLGLVGIYWGFSKAENLKKAEMIFQSIPILFFSMLLFVIFLLILYKFRNSIGNHITTGIDLFFNFLLKVF